MKAGLWLAASAGLAACSPSGGGNATANASARSAAAEAPHPTYCFFKDAAAKGWAASTDKSGNIDVKGKAHLDDTRYSGALIQGEARGDAATIWLTMAPNTTGYAMGDNWWDVSATIPNSAAAKTVTVMCGKKTLATLTVRRPK